MIGVIKGSAMKKSVFFVLFALGSCVLSHPCEVVQEVESQYKKSLEIVQPLLHEKAYNNYDDVAKLFSSFDLSLPKLLKKIDVDIKKFQKSAKGDTSKKEFLTQMRELSRFLKKHKLIYNAIFTHNTIRKTYQQLFNMVDNNEDIVDYVDGHRELFNLPNEDSYYLRVFLGQVKQAAHQISKFEDYVHSDYIDLKLQNYVFKIELIKLRNAILFDERYKFSK